MGTVTFTMDEIWEAYKEHVNLAYKIRADCIRECLSTPSAGAVGELEDFHMSLINGKYHQLTNVPHFLHCYNFIDNSMAEAMFDYAKSNFYIPCKFLLSSLCSQLVEICESEA